jgi:hypothetical protein
MGLLLYLLFFAGFFFLMMRFGCGAHVMGHGQHGNHGAEDRQNEDGSNRSAEPVIAVAPKPTRHDHA